MKVKNDKVTSTQGVYLSVLPNKKGVLELGIGTYRAATKQLTGFEELGLDEHFYSVIQRKGGDLVIYANRDKTRLEATTREYISSLGGVLVFLGTLSPCPYSFGKHGPQARGPKATTARICVALSRFPYFVQREWSRRYFVEVLVSTANALVIIAPDEVCRKTRAPSAKKPKTLLPDLFAPTKAELRATSKVQSARSTSRTPSDPDALLTKIRELMQTGLDRGHFTSYRLNGQRLEAQRTSWA